MEGKKTAVIAGATGLIGQSLVNLLIAGDAYQKIYILTRRSPQVLHPKLQYEKINFDQLDDCFFNEPIDDVYCALGSTIKKAGSKKAFRKVDLEYVIALARWSAINHVKSFSVVSSIGASPNSSNFYLRTKGQMEEAVMKTGVPAVYIYRPSFLTGHRHEFRLNEKLALPFMKIISPILKGKWQKYRPISGSQVAHAMYQMAQTGRQEALILESDEISTLRQ